MRKITVQQAMQYLEDDDVVLESMITFKNYFMFRRYNEKEWVYVELP